MSDWIKCEAAGALSGRIAQGARRCSVTELVHRYGDDEAQQQNDRAARVERQHGGKKKEAQTALVRASQLKGNGRYFAVVAGFLLFAACFCVFFFCVAFGDLSPIPR